MQDHQKQDQKQEGAPEAGGAGAPPEGPGAGAPEAGSSGGAGAGRGGLRFMGWESCLVVVDDVAGRCLCKFPKRRRRRGGSFCSGDGPRILWGRPGVGGGAGVSAVEERGGGRGNLCLQVWQKNMIWRGWVES